LAQYHIEDQPEPAGERESVVHNCYSPL